MTETSFTGVRPWWVIDAETGPRPDVAGLLSPVKAPSNYKDPLKILQYEQEAQAKQVADAALSVNRGRVEVIGLAAGDGEPCAVVCRTEADETAALADLWRRWIDAGRPVFVGFFAAKFDLPFLITRSRILGVPDPKMELGRYRHPDVLDLAQILTFDWMLDAETLGTYCKVYGIPHSDTTKGRDVPALLAAGDYEAVVAHCLADVAATRALARKLGVV